MEEGFIKLYRRLLDSSIFAHPIGLKIWVWCLLKAAHKKRTISLFVGKGYTSVEVDRGQFIFGRLKAEDELCIDGSTVYKWIHKLQDMDMISLNSNNQYTIVSICNYDDYQQLNGESVTAKEQPSNSQVTTEEQQSNTYKKVKKVKNDKKYIYTTFESLKNHPDLALLSPEMAASYLKYLDRFYNDQDQQFRTWRENLGHMHNLEPKGFANLIDDFGAKKVASIIDDMANYDGIKKKKSIYLTIKNWANRK